jgi:hypothetical protein
MFDHLKNQLNASLQGFAAGKAQDRQQRQGKSLPCTVVKVVTPGTVLVNFEVQTGTPWTIPQMEVPISDWDYIRYPIKAGDKGRCVPSDVRLGGVTGLGSGIPDFTPPGNLGALAFEPLGNTAWTAPIADDDVEIMGNLRVKPDEFGVFAESATQQEITGELSMVSDPNAMAVLQSIIAAGVAYGLWTDETT